ncbi:hypothetical protein Q31b_10900 [Novipirellula aureliae]|uniref:Uncharacterized protein n=1 Tax=Novipirellula aureliae TaxID=2527966 RepID=A0A5C6EBW0_9BACT|nr:hypothetical protein [Novipirellula aureliae]TWU45914.1 hypothetical protein Q31b_10900 [Novipirellula aureliae]
MTKETYRSIGAIVGITIGVFAMWLLNFGGLVPGFFFGAGGAVVGGISGERIFARMNRP